MSVAPCECSSAAPRRHKLRVPNCADGALARGRAAVRLAPPAFAPTGDAVRKTCLSIAVLALALLAGCAEYREYSYRDYQMSREQMYDGVMAILNSEGYEVVEREENFVNGLPQIEMKTDWNMSMSGHVYRGNDKRRKAFVTITTLYTERKEQDFQPLTEEEGKKYLEKREEDKKKAKLEQTRLGIAVNSERRDAIDRVLEAEWIAEGPDALTASQLLGRFEAWFGEKTGGGVKPSRKGEKLVEEGIRHGNR